MRLHRAGPRPRPPSGGGAQAARWSRISMDRGYFAPSTKASSLFSPESVEGFKALSLPM